MMFLNENVPVIFALDSATVDGHKLTRYSPLDGEPLDDIEMVRRLAASKVGTYPQPIGLQTTRVD